MDYKQQILVGFTGLQSSPEPELIKDAGASDIVNLRFDKLGYLHSRNGVRAFEVNPQLDDIPSAKLQGVVGIGEYILSVGVSAEMNYRAALGIDTKIINANHAFPLAEYRRFLFMGMRITASAVAEGVVPPKERLVYCAVPLSSIPDSHVRWDVGLSASSDACLWMNKETANGVLHDGFLDAPARQMARWTNDGWVASNGRVADTNWIEHYHQYRQFMNTLVISDRVNSDSILHFEYDEAEPGEAKTYALRLQDDCLAEFDVDVVRMNFELGATEKNGAGVVNGMALYKLYLPKKISIATQDNLSDYFTNKTGDTLDIKEEGADPIVYNVSDELVGGNALFSGVTLYLQDIDDSDNVRESGGMCKALLRDKSLQYIFSDHDSPKEIYNVGGIATVIDPDIDPIYDEDSKRIVDAASDVYIWEDCRQTYYPVSAKEYGQGLLRDIDRDFEKTDPVAPKLVRTKNRAGLEQYVALGVWAYRFVWDFGNGEYSAPSATMLCPDQVYSMLKDGDVTDGGSYQRPRGLSSADFVKTPTTALAGTGDLATPVYSFPRVHYNNSGTISLTSYGMLFKNLKEKLYYSTHRYSASADRDEMACSIVAFSEGNLRKCTGTIVHGAVFKATANMNDGGIFGDGNNLSVSFETAVSLPLQVPLWQNEADPVTFNSVFTDPVRGGKFRAGYARTTDSVYEFVVGGYSYPFQLPVTMLVGGPMPVAYDSNYHKDIDFIRYQTGVFFNLVCVDADENNRVDDALDVRRNETGLRITNKQGDRLLLMREDLPEEVRSRVIATGVLELELCSSGDYGVMRCEKKHGVIRAQAGQGNVVNVAGYPTGYQDTTVYTNPASLLERIGLLDYGSDRVIAPPVMDSGVIAFPKRYFGKIGSRDEDYVQGVNLYEFDNWQDFQGANDAEKQANWWRAQIGITNVTVAVHVDADRLLLAEQISAYVPSSLLFAAPRVSLRIAAADIPRRAKRLRIYRTMASHRNGWQPTEFGLVKDVDLTKDSAGVRQDMNFFDDVRDSELDFQEQPNEYDGMRTPLKSRFNLALAERMWKLNFEETYQPLAPRGAVTNYGMVHPVALRGDSATSLNMSAHPVIVDNVPANVALGYSNVFMGKIVEYLIVFKDVSGVYSPVKRVNLTAFSGEVSKLGAVFISLAGYPYTAGLDVCEVYRRMYATPGIGVALPVYERLGTIEDIDEGVFVDQGQAPDGGVWEHYEDELRYVPISEPYVDDDPDGVRFSQIHSPSWYKLEDKFSVARGDGDCITGATVHSSGDMVVFKQRSIHRLGLAGRSTVERIDQVSKTFGCIAPLTLTQYNDKIYFLSRDGFMMYDNNVFAQADGDFQEDLRKRLRHSDKNEIDPAVRDASCAINAVYNELYLNIPAYGGKRAWSDKHKGAKGHVYVLNLATNMWTKFSYADGDADAFVPGEIIGATSRGTWDRTQGRVYCTLSNGELISADVLPRALGIRSLLYLEAPTNRYYDDFQPGIQSSGAQINAEILKSEDVKTFWRSKSFTSESVSMLKRVRRMIPVMTSGERRTITLETNSADYLREHRSSYPLPTLGEVMVIPAQVPGGERGERVAMELRATGNVEIQQLSIIWRQINMYAR